MKITSHCITLCSFITSAKFTEWTDWSECPVSCGAGEIYRTRKCIGGKQWDEGCVGSLRDEDVCNKPKCKRGKLTTKYCGLCGGNIDIIDIN